MNDTPIVEATSAAEPALTEQFTQIVDQLKSGQIPDPLMAMLVKSAIALLAVIVTYFVASLLARWMSAAICKKVDTTLGRFAGKMTFYGIWILALSALLPFIGLQTAGLAAVMAAAGFAIGLSFQGTLSNFAAGILLLVFRPFKAGDLVTAAGVTGKVYEIDLFTTILDTFDNRRLVVPNSSITGANIENMSYHKHRRVDVVVGVAYASDIDLTRTVLEESAQSLSEYMVEGEGRGYQVLLSNLAASAVEWTVRFWAPSEEFFKVREKLTTEIKQRLDASGIQIPFPQMQLHLTPQAGNSLADASLAETTQGSFPLPNMPTNVPAMRTGRVRPRVRGESQAS